MVERLDRIEALESGGRRSRGSRGRSGRWYARARRGRRRGDRDGRSARSVGCPSVWPRRWCRSDRRSRLEPCLATGLPMRSCSRATRGSGHSCGLPTRARPRRTSTSPWSAFRPTTRCRSEAGARSGPRRSAAPRSLLRNYNPILRRQRGRAAVDRRLGRCARRCPATRSTRSSAPASAVEDDRARGRHALCLGGDHTVLLAELRALARCTGRSGSSSSTRTTTSGTSTSGRRCSTGASPAGGRGRPVDPARSVQAGLRGSLNGPADVELPARVRDRRDDASRSSRLGPGGLLGGGCASASAPGLLPLVRRRLRRPRVRARHRHARGRRPVEPEALDYVRSLAGLDFRGSTASRSSPPYDPAGRDGALAANACYEMLSLLALRR